MDFRDRKPDWWRNNEELREQMGLPPYRPPRFRDGAYVHEEINQLERIYRINILLVGRDVRRGDDWEITVDGNQVESISYRRDNNSNTVYELNSKMFRKIVEDSL